jgi:Predicted nucleotide-binding protein containing TIR-like domain
MNKSKIFIASSERTYGFAEMLRDELNKKEYCDANTWKDAREIVGARAKIEMLEQWIREYDFAVIVFSKADMLVRELGEYLKTRDDCVFEAGLFMAAIGRNRCFLLSSIDKNDLPSDLGGINLLQFTEPSNFEDRQECGRRSQQAAAFILSCVQKDMGRGLANRPLSHDALLRRQQMESEGGELKEDQVVVAALQPLELELGHGAATQVRLNLDKNIRYLYLFQGSVDAADKVPQLLQLVLLSGLLGEEDADSFSRRGELVTAHRKEIVDALRDICVNDKLKVFFRKESRDLEYCIHNAASDHAARLYLKHGEEFIEWESGPQAYWFWCAMREKNGAEDPQPANAVFHGAQDFELREGSFMRHLKIGMNKYFRDIAGEVMQLCLEGPR